MPGRSRGRSQSMLSDHAAVFGIGFAINLAFGLIYDRVEKVFLKFARDTEWVGEIKNNPAYRDNHAIAAKCNTILMNTTKRKYEVVRIRETYIKFMPYLVTACVVLIMLAGFFPSLEMPWWALLLVDAAILLPVPITLISTNVVAGRRLSLVRQDIGELKRAVKGINRA